MNVPQTYDAGIAHQIGRYSDGIRLPAGFDQIVVSGTPGLDEKGNIPPTSLTRHGRYGGTSQRS